MTFSLRTQVTSEKLLMQDKFYFDAIVFRDENSKFARVDVYVLQPYEFLNFVKNENVLGAAYDIVIDVFDEQNERVMTSKKERRINETDYFVTQGGTAAFDITQSIFTLAPGKYRIKVVIIDKFNNTESEKTRVVSVIDFDSFEFSLSGLLLVSSIEDVGGRYKITPHVSDNIGSLKDGFFVFFEAYSKIANTDSVDFIWEILDAEQKKIIYGNRNRRKIPTGTSRHYIKVPEIAEITTGTYTFRMLAVQTLDNKEYSDKDFLAVTQRSISYVQSISGAVLADLNLAIKQLRYAAFQNEIQYINAGETEAERRKRFEQFWKERDPTPSTERNEAFEEYFSRIDFANNTFRSYTDGWMTDMGMVYIIFGPPMSADRQTGYGDNRIYERWIYGNNREFLFVDNTGFGDFRLVRPMTVTEKYRFQR